MIRPPRLARVALDASPAGVPARAAVGDPEPAETVEPTPPAPRPGPRLVPDVLGAVLENAAAGGAFSTFARAIRGAGLTALPRGGEFTLFAPTDRAFAKLPAAELEALLQDTPRLARLVAHLLVPRMVRPPAAERPEVVWCVDGRELTVGVEDGVYRVNGARLVKPHIHASNGTVRGIDAVLGLA